MKLHFEADLPYQGAAIEAVCDLFHGQEICRTEFTDKASAPERRYYISSRIMPAIDFAKAVRAHWGIENGVHWMLDVNFQEDAATVRKDYAADNLSRLKRIVLKTETATLAEFGKLSLRKKRKLAAWEDGYREAMLRIRRAHDG